MRVTFLGATGTVTGSRYLIEHDRTCILIDCGLFQGNPELRQRNWQAAPFNPAALDAILLTHAHIDHSGAIPRLVRDGFKGPIYCSEATADLCAILLPDSGRIQEDDAETANRYGYSRHAPALPLYTEADAHIALEQFRPVGLGTPHDLSPELSFTLSRAGHILGASFIDLRSGDGTSILFTGDIGRPNSPVMKAPAQLQGADYIVLEFDVRRSAAWRKRSIRSNRRCDPPDRCAGRHRCRAGFCGGQNAGSALPPLHTQASRAHSRSSRVSR